MLGLPKVFRCSVLETRVKDQLLEQKIFLAPLSVGKLQKF